VDIRALTIARKFVSALIRPEDAAIVQMFTFTSKPDA
jgi:hypothetical protein